MSHRHLIAIRTLVFLSVVGTTLFSAGNAHAQTVTGNGYVLSGNAIPITTFTSNGTYGLISGGSPISGAGTSGGGFSTVPGSSGGAGTAGATTTPVTPVTPTNSGGGGGGVVFGNTNATPTPTAHPAATTTPKPTAKPTTTPSSSPAATATPTPEPSISPQPTASGKPSAPSKGTTSPKHAAAPGTSPSPEVSPSPAPGGSLINTITGTGATVSPEPTIAPATTDEKPLPSPQLEEMLNVQESPVSTPVLRWIILALSTITLTLKLIRKKSIRRKPVLELVLALVMTILTVVCVIFEASWYYIVSTTFSILALLISAYDLDKQSLVVGKKKVAAKKKK